MQSIKKIAFNTFFVIAALFIINGCGKGKTKIQTWHDEKQTLLKEEYIGTQKDPEIRDGVYKPIYPNGQVMEEKNYVNGNLEGKYTFFADDGSKKEEAEYKATRLNGKRLLYYPDGKV